jgi:hypothetical protein
MLKIKGSKMTTEENDPCHPDAVGNCSDCVRDDPHGGDYENVYDNRERCIGLCNDGLLCRRYAKYPHSYCKQHYNFYILGEIQLSGNVICVGFNQSKLPDVTGKTVAIDPEYHSTSTGLNDDCHYIRDTLNVNSCDYIQDKYGTGFFQHIIFDWSVWKFFEPKSYKNILLNMFELLSVHGSILMRRSEFFGVYGNIWRRKFKKVYE